MIEKFSKLISRGDEHSSACSRIDEWGGWAKGHPVRKLVHQMLTNSSVQTHGGGANILKFATQIHVCIDDIRVQAVTYPILVCEQWSYCELVRQTYREFVIGKRMFQEVGKFFVKMFWLVAKIWKAKIEVIRGGHNFIVLTGCVFIA